MNRTKTYLLVFSLLCFSGNLFTQDITSDARIKIEDLNAASIGLHDKGAGNQVRLLAPDYTGITGARSLAWTEGLNIQCYNENGSGTSTYRAALFSNDQTGYQSSYYPYLQIEPEEGTTITHIAFKAYNLTNVAGMTYGLSSGKGLDLTEADFEILSYEIIPGILEIPDSPLHIDRGTANACVVCRLTASGIEKIPVPADKQTIRIAARTDFPSSAGGTFINPVQPFYLLGIYIWTDQGIPSSLVAAQEPALESYIRDEVLYFDREVSQVSVYNLSGVLLSRSANVRSLSLDTFSSGVYLVKALSRDGQ
ncbi:MAG: T9SS type A sorting domain-containing protein [Candidatus Azobacteroides sp.]|nr:T9SS type A sorting domain-containing protein [Candidatus Azobacteroides sp.]